jgi:hypothetical protein
LFGDDLVSVNTFNGIFPNLTSTLISCSEAINYLIDRNMDFVYFCTSSDFFFKDTCCQTCSSTIYIYFYINMLTVNFFKSIKMNLVWIRSTLVQYIRAYASLVH